MSVQGFITIHRKLRSSDLWLGESFTRGQAWVDLLILANWKAGHVRIRGVRIDLARGQLAASSIWLAERWKWSRGKVTRFLSELEADQRIRQQKTNVTSLVTIVNYDSYQTGGTANEATNRTTDEAANGPQVIQQTDTQEQEYNQEQPETKKVNQRAAAATTPRKDKQPKASSAEAKPANVEAVAEYMATRGGTPAQAAKFWDHFTSNGWKVGGKAAMKDWRASVRNWLANDRERVNSGYGKQKGFSTTGGQAAASDW